MYEPSRIARELYRWDQPSKYTRGVAPDEGSRVEKSRQKTAIRDRETKEREKKGGGEREKEKGKGNGEKERECVRVSDKIETFQLDGDSMSFRQPCRKPECSLKSAKCRLGWAYHLVCVYDTCYEG